MHTSILKRVGFVLLVVGFADIGVMIYCISNGIPYASSLNVFAVIAGVFLLRVNLRTAVVVRWLAVYGLAGHVSLLLALPLIFPWGLILTQFRLQPGLSIAIALFVATIFGLLAWIIWELGREPVRAARASAGRKQRDMRIPAVLGVGLVTVLTIVVAVMSRSKTAERAKSLAKEQVGPGYRFHVGSLNITKSGQSTFVSGIVTAWNEKEIRNIQVNWTSQ